VARVRNSISILSKSYLSISPDSITTVYKRSEKMEMPMKVRYIYDDDDVYLRLQHGKGVHNLVHISYVKHINPASKA
jgi:hypothetical protein